MCDIMLSLKAIGGVIIHAKVLMNYNRKGGVGKTTMTAMQGYLMSQQGYKMLLIDFDPQKNLTTILNKTYKDDREPINTMSNVLTRGTNLKSTILSYTDNLDIIKGEGIQLDKDGLDEWGDKIGNLKAETRVNILNNLLEPLKDEYDYILIDVPPSFNNIVKNAVMASDGINLMLQTQGMSFESSKDSIIDLMKLERNFKTHFQLLGTLLYLQDDSSVDVDITKKAQEFYNEVVYKYPVKVQRRAKWFMSYGIDENSYWAQRSIRMYKKAVQQIIERAEEKL